MIDVIGNTAIGNSGSYWGNTVIVPLSKNTTYGDIVDIIRLKCRLVGKEIFSNSAIVREIMYGVSKFAMSVSDDKYGMRSRVNISGNANPYIISLANLNPSVKALKSVVYLGRSRTPIEITDIRAIEFALGMPSSYSRSLMCANAGDHLELFIGPDISPIWKHRSIEIAYERVPSIVDVTLSTKVDVLDECIPALTDNIADRINMLYKITS